MKQKQLVYKYIMDILTAACVNLIKHLLLRVFPLIFLT